MGRNIKALDYYRLAAKLYAKLGNRYGQARQLINKANLQRKLRKYSDATKSLAEVMDIIPKIENINQKQSVQASHWFETGCLFVETNYFLGAQTAFQHAVWFFNATGHKYDQYRAREYLGDTLKHMRKFRDAISCYETVKSQYLGIGHGDKAK